jgi:hypothetical protein
MSNLAIAAKDIVSLSIYANDKQSLLCPVGTISMTNAVVLTHSNRPVEVWVRPDYTGYKHAYSKAMKTPDVGYDIDHLYPKSWAKDRYGYVRIYPIMESVNRSAGTFIEKILSDNERKGAVVNIVYLNHFTQAKLSNVCLGGKATAVRVAGKQSLTGC